MQSSGRSSHPATGRRALRRFAALALAVFAAGAAVADSSEPGRIVVRYKATLQAASAATVAETMSRRAAKLGVRAGVKLRTLRSNGSRAAVFSTPAGLDALQLRALALKIAQDPAVASAEADVRVSASSNDPYFSRQWALGAPAARAGGANFVAAWPYSTGSDVVVAVLDTGMTSHPDLSGRQFAGYDFVSDTTMGADGSGRDADPSDPGDACASSGSSSSWHGTAVASQIVAVADNGYGIAGGAPDARVLQVRVLGKCGGWLSDTADAIAWLAGRSFAGVPAPSVQPRIINMSLGGATSCPSYMQEAINLANSAGIVVIAAAGNDGRASISAPANCSGVIAVAAATATGDLASYSNYSAQVAITAPGGGNCRQATAGCDTTPTLASGVLGANGFTGFSEARYFNGTSAATPQVAAAAALLLAYQPSLTAAQVRSALLSGVHGFPAGSFCTTAGRCGSGLLDAAGAVWTLAAPLVTITPVSGISTSAAGAAQSGLVARGAAASLRASASSDGSYSYAWRQSGGSAASALSGSSSDTLGFTAPSTPGLISFVVTATDGAGMTARNSVTLRVNSAPDTLPEALAAGYAGVPYQATLPARDGDGDVLSHALVEAPAGVTLSADGRLAWSSPVQGSHTLKIAASDPYGQQTTASVALTIQAAPAVPTVPGGSLRAKAGKAFSAATGVTGPSVLPISYALAGAPRGLSISSSGVLAWAAPVAGSYRLSVTASNRSGSASAVYTLAVGPANRVPVMAARSFAATARVAWSAQLGATDADGDTLIYTLPAGAPSGLTLESGGRMSWASPVGGRYGVQVRVGDGWGGAVIRTMTLVVTDPNHAPVLTMRSYAAVAGSTWSGQILARDADGDSLVYTLGAVPAGLSVNADGLMSWAQPRAGSYTFSVRASDRYGAASNVNLTLLVTSGNTAPTVVMSTHNARAGVAWSAAVQASDPEGDVLRYAAGAGVPAGLTVGTGGMMRWARPVRGSYVFNVRVTDSKGAFLSVPLKLVVS